LQSATMDLESASMPQRLHSWLIQFTKPRLSQQRQFLTIKLRVGDTSVLQAPMRLPASACMQPLPEERT
jgi:hypothetical protein